MRLPGLGPKTARRIWQELGITTVDGLRDGGRGAPSCATSAGSARSRRRRSWPRSRSRARGGAAARAARHAPCRGCAPSRRSVAAHPAAVQVSIAGSARRFRETVRDLDLIATATDAPALLDAFCALPWVVEVAARGDTKATVVAQDGLRFDLRVVPPECYGNLLQHFTGSKAHNVALREAAVRRGLSVSEYGITEVETGEVHAFATEEEVYAFLGYAWIPPELREDGGELEAARDGHAARSWSSSATCAATCTRTRPGRTGRTRSRRWSPSGRDRGYDYYADLRPLPPPARRAARAAVGGDRRARTSRCRSRS